MRHHGHIPCPHGLDVVCDCAYLCIRCMDRHPQAPDNDWSEPLSVTRVVLDSEPYHGRLSEGAFERIQERLRAELDRMISEALVGNR